MPKKDGNRSRWNIHPLWLSLSTAPWEGAKPNYSLLKRVRATKAPPDDILAYGFGYVMSYMAAKGIKNVREGMPRYMEFCYRHYEAKLRGNGRIFEEWVRDRVRAKAQLYGTMDNLPKPTEAEIA